MSSRRISASRIVLVARAGLTPHIVLNDILISGQGLIFLLIVALIVPLDTGSLGPAFCPCLQLRLPPLVIHGFSTLRILSFAVTIMYHGAEEDEQ